ncbi:MAG: hypothetical protein CK528_08250 [Alcaligenaceae bacterium]|nr:MAG: hypothetical protein CK528_08250 [Alcaligenaceae bacterium]
MLRCARAEASNWYAFFAPARTLRAIVQRLNTEIHQVMGRPEILKGLLDQGGFAHLPPAKSVVINGLRLGGKDDSYTSQSEQIT